MAEGDPVSERLYGNFFADAALPYCGMGEALAFLEAVAAASPFAQRALIERQILPAFRSGTTPPQALGSLLAQVAGMARQGGLETPFAAHDRSVVEGALKPFVEAVNDREAGRRSVLFVVTTPYFVILREAMYLRQNGHRVYLLSLSPLPGNLQALFAAHFDAVADVRNSFRMLRSALQALRPDVVHVQCWMWMYVLGRLAIESCPDSAVVCEFYDATSLFAPPEDMAARWNRRLIDLDIDLERFILKRADAVVSRYAPDIGAAWGAQLGIDAFRYMEFQPYPCREFTHYATARTGADGPVRLVHAGSFVPPDGNHPPALYPEISMPRVFRSLLEQGFAIDTYSVPNFDLDKLGPEFAPYRQLAAEFETFRLLPGIPPDRFAEAIAGYDYGILLFDYDPRTTRIGPLWMRGVMPTRFFSYLEAGVPGIVIGEYENMAGFLEENGLGFGVPSRDLPDLARIVAAKDRGALAANIRAYNEAHGMHREIHRLIALYDEICRR